MSEAAEIPENERPAVWCAGREWCAVTCTMDVVGNRWHPVIIHRLLDHGPLRFNELSEEVGPNANKVLSNGLRDRGGKGLVERLLTDEQPVAVQYELPERDRSLSPVIEASEERGMTHLKPAESEGMADC